MTFSQTKKPPINTVSAKKFTYPFKFYEKKLQKNSLYSKFKNKIQTAVSGTKHTDKNKVIHRKLISNPFSKRQRHQLNEPIHANTPLTSQPVPKTWINRKPAAHPASTAGKRRPNPQTKKEATTG